MLTNETASSARSRAAWPAHSPTSEPQSLVLPKAPRHPGARLRPAAPRPPEASSSLGLRVSDGYTGPGRPSLPPAGRARPEALTCPWALLSPGHPSRRPPSPRVSGRAGAPAPTRPGPNGALVPGAARVVARLEVPAEAHPRPGHAWDPPRGTDGWRRQPRERGGEAARRSAPPCSALDSPRLRGPRRACALGERRTEVTLRRRGSAPLSSAFVMGSAWRDSYESNF